MSCWGRSSVSQPGKHLLQPSTDKEGTSQWLYLSERALNIKDRVDFLFPSQRDPEDSATLSTTKVVALTSSRILPGL